MIEFREVYSTEYFFFLWINLVCVDFLREDKQITCRHFYNFQRYTAVSMLFCNYFKKSGFIHVVLPLLPFCGCLWSPRSLSLRFLLRVAVAHFFRNKLYWVAVPELRKTEMLSYIDRPLNVSLLHLRPLNNTSYRSNMFHWLHWG